MSERNDESTTVASRRQFLGKAAATAVAATAIPGVLAACGESATASEATHTPASNGLRASLGGGRDPGQTLSKMVAGTIGSAPDVSVPALEKGVTTKYLQRIITSNSRVGTGLATVCKKNYSFSDGTTVQVVVQDNAGRAYSPRTISKNSDLAYAMKDALSTNPLVEGVLKSSLNAGSHVVALSKSSIVAFADSVASDFYGNHLDIVSRGFCDLFNTTVSGIKIASTTRDLNRC